MKQKNKSELINFICFILFMALGIPMFYFIDGAITIGGFGFMYHYLFGIGIILIAFLLFLLKPDIKLLKDILIITLLLSTVYIVMVTWSFLLYAVNFEDSNIMTDGIFKNVYVIIAILVAACIYYMFTDKAVLYTTYAMGFGNLIILCPVFASNPSGFIEELITLIITFGEDTGPLMKSIEIHDLTFAFGLIFLYALIDKGLYNRKQILVISAFFSITGLKRIAVGGIVLSASIYWIISKLRKYKAISYVLCIIITVISFVYIVAVHNGLFDYLESIGMDTKGRDIIYNYINSLFEISPGYLGNGIGYSSKAWDLPFYSSIVQDAYHNEFLRMYVEMGFWGYFAWISTHLPLRIGMLFKFFGKHAGLTYLAAAVYCYITYATDNTYYYYYLNFAVFLIIFTASRRIDSQQKNYIEKQKSTGLS